MTTIPHFQLIVLAVFSILAGIILILMIREWMNTRKMIRQARRMAIEKQVRSENPPPTLILTPAVRGIRKCEVANLRDDCPRCAGHGENMTARTVGHELPLKWACSVCGRTGENEPPGLKSTQLLQPFYDEHRLELDRYEDDVQAEVDRRFNR